MSGSTAFDRAAGYYDSTRGRTPAGVARETEILAAELDGRGRVLEVGVGTGQVALPLHSAGIPMTGIDLAVPMLDVLRAKSGGVAPFPLVLGDATTMPFAHSAFGGVVLRWVLHLIPEWQRAVAEIVRVLRPGAVVAVMLGSYGDGPAERIKVRFCEAAGMDQAPIGLDWADYGSIDAAMAARGATARDLEPFTDVEAMSVEDFMRGVEDDAFSWTWRAPADVRAAAAAQARAWAEQEYGRLDRLPPRTYDVTWRVYDLP